MASPSELVTTSIGNAWAKAAELSAESRAEVADALSYASVAPTAGAPYLVPAPVMPSSPRIPEFNPNAVNDLYKLSRDELISILAGDYGSFISTYFGGDTYTTAAQNWLTQALTTGGTGINAIVEAQVWERARARALADAARAQQEVDVNWAARRFPVPPAAYLSASLQITRTAQDAVAEAARTAAIESFSREVDSVRIAVERSIMLRQAALAAAGDYIRTLSGGAQVGTSVSATSGDLQQRFVLALTEYYRAQIAAVETPLRAQITNSGATLSTNTANLQSAVSTLQARVNAVVASAQMLGSQAAAAFNAIHTQASVSGNDSTVTSVEG